ncbi:hypothetical protein [Roseimicrobium sp. ORNL1]|uniref:hypothetical protein n=1 Tax=Roseimicrobium sp. ORNL1 TaxID=2711231 RepID=UPI0013E15B40|nr:hypothetical protein [Roseimicrobium sp. ORNL1]QIF00068.1 hypothetical protein G5S37_00545 [Roseimicrobium sp. ORNL1]
MLSLLDRAIAYLAKMPPAISGQGGHVATFKAAVVLVKGFALSEAEALPILQGWNVLCDPPWTERELRQKLRSAARSSTMREGCLRGEAEVHPANHSLHDEKPHSHAHEDDHHRAARLRKAWPRFTPLTADPVRIESLAKLRHLPPAAVQLTARLGYLGHTVYQGHHCYAVGEDTFAQVRKFSGEAFLRKDGSTVKALNLPGSRGAFLGQRMVQRWNRARILLAEGSLALVEGIAAAWLVERPDWIVLAATSASSRFERCPELLAALRGRQVRILPDADETGLNAAGVWLSELRNAGVLVDAAGLPPGCHDLGDAVAQPKRYGAFLRGLFS